MFGTTTTCWIRTRCADCRVLRLCLYACSICSRLGEFYTLVAKAAFYLRAFVGRTQCYFPASTRRNSCKPIAGHSPSCWCHRRPRGKSCAPAAASASTRAPKSTQLAAYLFLMLSGGIVPNTDAFRTLRSRLAGFTMASVSTRTRWASTGTVLRTSASTTSRSTTWGCATTAWVRLLVDTLLCVALMATLVWFLLEKLKRPFSYSSRSQGEPRSHLLPLITTRFGQGVSVIPGRFCCSFNRSNQRVLRLVCHASQRCNRESTRSENQLRIGVGS